MVERMQQVGWPALCLSLTSFLSLSPFSQSLSPFLWRPSWFGYVLHNDLGLCDRLAGFHFHSMNLKLLVVQVIAFDC